MGLDIPASHDYDRNTDLLQEYFRHESRFRKSLTNLRSSQKKSGDLSAHIWRMEELWGDVLMSKAYTSRDAPDAFLALGYFTCNHRLQRNPDPFPLCDIQYEFGR